MNWVANGLSATVPSVMAMISADRMKSVRIAPSPCPFRPAPDHFRVRQRIHQLLVMGVILHCLCGNLWASFSKPSKHKRRRRSSRAASPPRRKGADRQCQWHQNRLVQRRPWPPPTPPAARDPPPRPTPAAFSARSSPARLDVFGCDFGGTATSSRMVAISSIRAKKTGSHAGTATAGGGTGASKATCNA